MSKARYALVLVCLVAILPQIATAASNAARVSTVRLAKTDGTTVVGELSVEATVKPRQPAPEPVAPPAIDPDLPPVDPPSPPIDAPLPPADGGITFEGVGSETRGGAGGAVIKVTNLNDSGAGSLRACMVASGPRTCVFTVAGYIDLQSPIEVDSPFLTVAGQTAPGGGITLRSADGRAEAAVKVKTHDVILQFFRIRTGTPIQDHHLLGVNAGSGATGEAAAHNIVIDHLSSSWNGDEQWIFYQGTHDVTVQWSINSEAIHDGSPASKGMVIGPENNPGPYSLHHNLFAHNNQRNPNVTMASGGVLDFRYNTVYNYGYSGMHLKGAANANVVGNYIKFGPNHRGKPYILDDSSGAFYAEGNSLDQSVTDGTLASGSGVGSPFSAPSVGGGAAAEEHRRVLADAGASRGLACDGSWFSRRDAVDARVVQSVIDGTRGHDIASTLDGLGFISSPSDVGGYPPLAAGTPCTDGDDDGMPDIYETARRLNPSANDSAGDADDDGYTNLEEFLYGL